MQQNVATYQPPTDEELMEMRLDWLRTCKPKELARMRRAGELQEHLKDCAEATRGWAEMPSGEWAGQAWKQAIRWVICESEDD